MMVPFWVLGILRHLVFRALKRGPLTTTHIVADFGPTKHFSTREGMLYSQRSHIPDRAVMSDTSTRRQHDVRICSFEGPE